MVSHVPKPSRAFRFLSVHVKAHRAECASLLGTRHLSGQTVVCFLTRTPTVNPRATAWCLQRFCFLTSFVLFCLLPFCSFYPLSEFPPFPSLFYFSLLGFKLKFCLLFSIFFFSLNRPPELWPTLFFCLYSFLGYFS